MSDDSPKPNEHISPDHSPWRTVRRPGSHGLGNAQPGCSARTIIPEAGRPGHEYTGAGRGGEGRVRWTFTAPQSKSTSPFETCWLEIPHKCATWNCRCRLPHPRGVPGGFKQWLLCVPGPSTSGGGGASGLNPNPPPPPPSQQLESFSDTHAWNRARGATRWRESARIPGWGTGSRSVPAVSVAQ